MKLKSTFRITLCTLLLIFINSIIKSQTVTDYDGNVYQTVTIGNQIWMAENLRTTHYSDGTPIENGTGLGEIESNDTTKRFFYYNDNPIYSESYGCLYSWHAAVRGMKSSNTIPSGIQGVCPSGWHIPSDREWTELELQLGMSPSDTSKGYERGTNQGDQLKVGGSSGFNGVLGGNREYDDGISNNNVYFYEKDIQGNYITSNTEKENKAHCLIFVIKASSAQTFRWGHNKCCGYSVRCLKDSQTSSLIKLNDKTSYTIYPNPCKDYVYINSNDSKINKICIYSIEGKQVKSANMQRDSKISVLDIENGFYLITVNKDNSIYTDKLIIEK